MVRYDTEPANREQTYSETDPFTTRRYRQFARNLGLTGAALDVGCNTGRGGQAFREAAPGWILDGVELIAERLGRLPPGVYRNTWPGLLEDLPKDAGPYMAVLAGEVIEHIPLQAIDGFLRKAMSLLEPGGKVLLTTPNPHYVLLGRRSGGTVLGGAHVSAWCPEALREYLEWTGFRVERITGSGQASRLLGTRFPRTVYGSYLTVASRPTAAN